MSDRFSIAAILMLLCLAVSLVGCLGSGSQTASLTEPETPESAVSEIFASWRANSSQLFAIGADGRVTAQTTASETRYIRFRDFSGTDWQLIFTDVTYVTSELARVNTLYYYNDNPAYGGLRVVFLMAKDDGNWFLEGLEIVALPAVVVDAYGVKGVITDKISGLPVSEVRVEAYNQATNAISGYAVTDTAGFYQITEMTPGTYYLVINRDGYEPYTISGVVVN